MAKKGLGRGFDSLIPTDLFDETFDPTARQDEQVSDLKNLQLREVSPDADQPRRHFDEASLTELANSIAQHGILQPIVVTKNKDSGYTIVAGERRYRAALQAGLEHVPALVRSLSGQHKLEVSLIENIQRRDLNPLETATAYLKLKDQFNLTLDQIGERVGGKSVSTISNTLRLLRLPDSVKQALFDGRLTEGQARPLIGLDEQDVAAMIDRIIKEEWSARRVEQFAAALRDGARLQKAVPVTGKSFTDYASQLTKRYQSRVRIKTNSKGGGQIILPFKDEKDLERLKRLLDD